MAAIPNGLTRDQFELALHEINPTYSYRFLDDGSYEWRGTGDVPSDQTITDAWTAYNTAQTAAATSATAARTAAVNIAGSAVGVAIGSLTAAQVRALVACLLWKNGALNSDGTVKPLASWL